VRYQAALRPVPLLVGGRCGEQSMQRVTDC
jgi:hypothetical protein